MKTATMTRIDVLQSRISSMQAEIAELQKNERFKFPVRCTVATVNAALEAGGCAQQIARRYNQGMWGFVIVAPSGVESSFHLRTAKAAFENIIRYAK